VTSDLEICPPYRRHRFPPKVTGFQLHSDRADVQFARANIQIYDARVVDLYQWVCARYLVGVKGAETKAKRSCASALASAGTERVPSTSLAMSLSATAAIQAAPNDIPRMKSGAEATVQEDFVSMEADEHQEGISACWSLLQSIQSFATPCHRLVCSACCIVPKCANCGR
jgi:hypothetical protein